MFAIGILEETHGGSELAWLLWVALGFFALMVVVGWLVSRNRKPEAEPVHAHHEHHEAHAVEDDLVSLEGIGPKVAQVLKEAGITTFAALAEADAAKVQEILNAAGLQMMNPEGWIEQAKLAAKGDTEGLARLQAELKGGRRA
ncbi:MAG: helix-hairpin-helix domain-containing protein [Anaerolineales bacterium]